MYNIYEKREVINVFIYNTVVQFFTGFIDYGMPHCLIIVLLFLAMILMQVFALIINKPIVKWLPLIIPITISIISELSIWLIAAISGSLVTLIFIVILTYSVAAILGPLSGIVLYYTYKLIKKARKS